MSYLEFVLYSCTITTLWSRNAVLQCVSVCRPLTRSTDASMEKLRCSPSSLCSDDDDCGVYTDAYYAATWVYIGDSEELQVWQRPNSLGTKLNTQFFSPLSLY